MDYVIGCDLGSQAVKVVLISVEGKLAGEFGVGYGIDYPSPTWAEQDASIWINAIEKAIHGLIARTDIRPNKIKAIGLDAQVDGVVAIDATGMPLRPAIIWMDRRATKQCEKVEQVCSQDRFREISGLNLDPSHVAPKIRWIAENEPEIYRKTASFLLAGSYAAYYLTGELGVDFSNASSTLLMDVRSKTWSKELCDCFQIDQSRLAPIFPATHIIGQLRMEVAQRLGLPAHIPVILGSGDEHAACLGAGVTGPGLVCDIAGTAEPVCASSLKPLVDPTGLVETHCHADPDQWLLENPGFVSGANYRWFKDQFAIPEVQLSAQTGISAYELMNQAAAKVPPGSEGLIMLPCLMGAMTPTWNAKARGTLVGFTLAHRREHFIRAVMEASAYAVRDITDQMQQMGLSLKEIRIVGGGAQSPLWRQIKSDVSGLPVSITQTVETTSLGAAILALAGSHQMNSLQEAISATVKVIETSYPNPETQTRYEEFYHLYRSAYFALLPVFEESAKINL
jgi:xylulokinase